MNREIKFRAWDGKKMIYGFVPHSIIGTYSQLPSFVDAELGLETSQVMQYTGFADNKNKEIYEDDIVWFRRRGSSQDRDYLCQVRWNHQGGCWHFVSGKYYIEPMSSAQTGYYDEENKVYIVQLDNVFKEGNIYENPELLNTDKESI